jgi:crotonobetainyl-CoA:carnitine CoA-transferase CaiB-like acyl-CoA transferase
VLGTILSNLRVVDLTQNVAGPFCTQVLGDMGAEVIKIERPGKGDDTRDWLPPQIGGKSSTFLSLNRNKKSVCIDIDKEGGRTLVRRLAASADVLVHSLKPGSAEARGLGYADLKMHNPRLIYCAISAFGEVGPLRSLPGYDPLMQAFSGIMSVTGNEGDDPVRVSVSVIDVGTAMWSAMGILAALLQRATSGEGMRVHASLLETGLSWMSTFVASHLATGQLPRKMGSAMAMMAPYELFKSADGYVFIASGNDRLFVKACQALGCAQLAVDERFATNSSRVANRKLLHAEIEQRTLRRNTRENVAALREVGAPCSELNDVSQAIGHEQVRALGMITDLPVDGAPQHQVVGLPLTINGERSLQMSAPPQLGEHTSDVLAALGCSATELGELRRQAVIS